MGRLLLTKYADAYQNYLDGLSLEQIANVLGVTRQSVFTAFKRRNLPLRGPNFRPFQIYDNKKFTLRNTGYYSLSNGDRGLMHRYVWEKEAGPIPKGWDIHHKDNNKANNVFSNFECLPKAEHTSKYSPHHNQYTKCK